MKTKVRKITIYCHENDDAKEISKAFLKAFSKVKKGDLFSFAMFVGKDTIVLVDEDNLRIKVNDVAWCCHSCFWENLLDDKEFNKTLDLLFHGIES